MTEALSMPAAASAARPARPPRAPAPPLPVFDTLDAAHRAAVEMLRAFEQLIDQLNGTGLDDAARGSAARILAFFEGPGHDHHAQEEHLVFPELLAIGDEALLHHVRRLQQDHGWIEEDWRLLAPQIDAIARGYNWYDLPMLVAALPVFTALYQEHIALEETLVYPLAKQLLQARAQAVRDRGAAS